MKRTPKQVATGLLTLSDHEERLCALEDAVLGELPEPEPVVEKVKLEKAKPAKKKSKLDRLNE